LRRRGVG
jgi:hypothetical protein